jgi:cystathionine gamma-synthase (EC 2.5.1.48)
MVHLETISIHAGQEIDPTTGSVIPPIYLTTTFERAPDGSFPHGYIYTRNGNPNRAMLETCLATLEGGRNLRGVQFGACNGNEHLSGVASR